jgi:lambda family phage portal protein
MMNKTPKKKLAVRLYDAIFQPKAAEKRSYAAAKGNRLNVGWTSQPTTANWETRISLPALIARSRQAARDDLHIVNYLRLMRANVIGRTGLQLQSNARTPRGKVNVKLNQRVEQAWWEWSHAEMCTVSGKLAWKGVQDLILTQCERDGAFLVEMVEADNDFAFALKVWDVTWLDVTFSQELPAGNRIIMSVEVDRYDRPVAYWMTQPNTETDAAWNRQRQRVRIPAERMIHNFLYHDDESQVHGIPGTAAALLPAKNAYSYSESVVMASRVAANQFAVLKNTMPDGSDDSYTGEDSEGNPTNPFINSSPLAITQMLPGWELQQFKPEQPTQNHPAFRETLDMDIGAALGVPYFLLLGNWKAVNFSSSRGGLGEFRERCKSYQDFIATTFCRRVFNAWLRQAWLTGKLEMTPDEFREVQNPRWQARGFDYIDPVKDVDTDVTKLRNRLSTPSRVLGEQGIDLLDHLEQWQSDKDLCSSFGVDIEEIYADPKAPPAPAAEEEPPKSSAKEAE